MFERFTDRARKSLLCARLEATELGHDWIGTEHILLGLTREGSGVAARVISGLGITLEQLRDETLAALAGGPSPLTEEDAEALEVLGIDFDSVRQQIEETFGPGALSRRFTRGRNCKDPAFTPRAKHVLELSLREALRLGHNYIGTEHVLLGIVAEGEGLACTVLARLGADGVEVRARVMHLLRQVG